MLFIIYKFEGISVADRNGSLETNESSSPETNTSDLEIRPNKSNTGHVPSFDFNEFFNIDNIPGLSAPVSINPYPANTKSD